MVPMVEETTGAASDRAYPVNADTHYMWGWRGAASRTPNRPHMTHRGHWSCVSPMAGLRPCWTFSNQGVDP